MDTAAPAAFQSIPVDQLHPNPWNRQQFDPEKMEELIQSVKTKGVEVRLIVRPRPAGGYEIVDGERRWRAATKAGLKDVPCEIREYTDEQVAEMDIRVNIQRENLPPLETARMVNAYIERFQKTQQQAAEAFGKSQSWVSDVLSFLKIPAGVLEIISALIIAWDPLMAIKKSPPGVQAQIAKELKEGSLAPEQIEKRCNQLRFGTAQPPYPKSNESTERPPADPLAERWEEFQQEEKANPYTWQAEFKGPGDWQFEVFLGENPPGGYARHIGQWFLKMAWGFGETRLDQALEDQYTAEGREAQKAVDSFVSAMTQAHDKGTKNPEDLIKEAASSMLQAAMSDPAQQEPEKEPSDAEVEAMVARVKARRKLL